MHGLCIRVSSLLSFASYHLANTGPVVEASRSLLFDLHSRIGLNFGVLFAWAAVNSLFFPFCCYFMRWKTQRAKKEMEAKAAEPPGKPEGKR